MTADDTDRTMMGSDANRSPRPDATASRQEWGGRLLKPDDEFDGNLRIMARIGEGGMGEIYAAVHEEQRFAIKLIRADMAADFDQDDMLRKEAAALEELKSRYIVKYHYRRRDPVTKLPYIAMELVEGNRKPVEGVPDSWRAYSLKDYLTDEGALKVSQVLALARCLAEGLGAAHREGVFHRDLSPGNILLRCGDLKQPVIIDFGIAKVQRGEDRTIMRGEFRGTCNYASPEHFSQSPIEAPSDLYGLGLVLAAASLGRPLDMGMQDPMRAAMLRQSVPRLDGVPSRLRPLLTWLLQPKARNRPQSAKELLAFLDRSAPVIWSWRHRRAVAASASLLLAAGIAAPFLWPREPVPLPPTIIAEPIANQPAITVTPAPSPAASPPTAEVSKPPPAPPPVPPRACAAIHSDAEQFAAPACNLVDMLARIGTTALPGAAGAVFSRSTSVIQAGAPLRIDLSGTLPAPRHIYYVAVSDDGSVFVSHQQSAASGRYEDSVEGTDTTAGWTLFMVITSSRPLTPLDWLDGAPADIGSLTRSLRDLAEEPDSDRLTSWSLVRIRS